MAKKIGNTSKLLFYFVFYFLPAVALVFVQSLFEKGGSIVGQSSSPPAGGKSPPPGGSGGYSPNPSNPVTQSPSAPRPPSDSGVSVSGSIPIPSIPVYSGPKSIGSPEVSISGDLSYNSGGRGSGVGGSGSLKVGWKF